MDTENEKVIAERSKTMKAGIIAGGIALVAVCPLIVYLAQFEDSISYVMLYIVMVAVLIIVLIWRSVQLCTMPKILILYKNGKFYLYPDKKTEIELDPRQIRKVESKNYKGCEYRRYASTTGKLFITHDKGFTTFRFVKDVSRVCADIEKIRGVANFAANDTAKEDGAKTDENPWS